MWIVLVLGLLGFLVRGADRPADPYLEALPYEGGTGERSPLEGFEEVGFRITTPAGEELDWCALLAATSEARQQGLMGQQDLRGYDAMVFRFEEPTSNGFWMYRTLIPLSIAWFSPEGEYVSARQMEPCPSDESSECPSYPPEGEYLHAVEAPKGRLGLLGIVPGSRISFPGGPCP
jgi:uncharacterized protein